MTRLLASLGLIATTALFAGCVSAQSSVGSPSKPVRIEPAASPSASTVEGEVPASMVEQLRSELASQKGLNAADVKVVSAQSMNWPNGAIGCPRPGVMYTQAIVPGYRVVLEVAGERFAYHASKKGQFKLCKSGIGVAPPASAR